jgi:hypothetical protein
MLNAGMSRCCLSLEMCFQKFQAAPFWGSYDHLWMFPLQSTKTNWQCKHHAWEKFITSMPFTVVWECLWQISSRFTCTFILGLLVNVVMVISHTVEWLTCYCTFFNQHQALPIVLPLSYNLKHAKKATWLQLHCYITHFSLWWNLWAFWNAYVVSPGLDAIHVVLPEHVQPSLEWGLLPIKLGIVDCSPHLKIR